MLAGHVYAWHPGLVYVGSLCLGDGGHGVAEEVVVPCWCRNWAKWLNAANCLSRAKTKKENEREPSHIILTGAYQRKKKKGEHATNCISNTNQL